MLITLATMIAGMLIWAGIIFLQFRHTQNEARMVFDAQLNRKELPQDEPFEPFERAYLRTSGLRVSAYRWVASLAAMFTFPLAIMLFSFLWARMYYLAGRPAWMTEGELVHSFGLAVGGMGVLVATAWVFVQLYHHRQPPPFDEVWQSEKEALTPSGHGEPA